MKIVSIGFWLLLVCATSVRAEYARVDLSTPEKINEHYHEYSKHWSSVPQKMLLAFVTAEDRDFFDEPLKDSNITKHIVKWSTVIEEGTPRKVRKYERYSRSLIMGETLSHDEVLNWYANEIYLGMNCYGVHGAAEAYFGKAIKDLRLEEIAFLAILPKAPSSFHPVRNYERAFNSRNDVLFEMKNAGFITEAAAVKAAQTDLVIKGTEKGCPS